MNALEKVCLELCEIIFSTSSITDKTIISYSVKLFPGKKNTAEVVLVTKEDEYKFLLDLPEEDVYTEADSHLNHCLKCAAENKYSIREVNIKGFDAIEFGKIHIEHLKNILEKLAEDHAKCIEENNLEKKNLKTGLFSVSDEVQESFLDVVKTILKEKNESDIDSVEFIQGLNSIEKSYEAVTNLNNEYIYIYGNILHKKLFVKTSSDDHQDYKILNIRTDQNYPLVYDLLLTIFSFTDQEMRKQYFHELLDHYYNNLNKKLQKLCLEITKCLTLPQLHKQVKEFIPSAKLDILKQLCQMFAKAKKIDGNKENMEGHQQNILDFMLEVNECILYTNLSREDCYKIVNNRVGSNDYTFLNYKVIPVGKREGYLGDYFRLKIQIEYNGHIQILHLFAKYLPTYNNLVVELAGESFKKEEFYYTKLIPELENLGLESITDFLPKCFFSRIDDVLILEDISMNYRSFPVNLPFTYEMLLITVKQLAKIHACSLLYEELLSVKLKETIRFDNKYPEYIEEATYYNSRESAVKKNFDCSKRTCLDMVNSFPDILKQLSMEEFKRRAQIVFDSSYEKVKKSDTYRNVLCQGDCWASNILFKTDKDNLPIDCRIVDYQLTRYCPPGHDLNFLLYMTTTKDIRKKFASKLFKEYYTSLSNILQRYKIDLQKIYTYQQFLDCCNYMRSQGACHSIIILQQILLPEEKLKPIIEDNEKAMFFYFVNRDILVAELKNEGSYYTQRMKELLEELYEICECNF